MSESERASERVEEHIPLFCDKSLALHLADAVIGDIGTICALRAVGALSISQACAAVDERLRVLRELAPDRTVGQALNRLEMRLVADVLDSLHASREQERRERKEAKEREERIPNSNSNSKEGEAHSLNRPENTKCAGEDSSNSSSNSRACAGTAYPPDPSPETVVG